MWKVFIIILYLLLCEPIKLYAVEEVKKKNEGNVANNLKSFSEQNHTNENVDFTAQNIEYNFKENTLSATGNVIFKSEGKTLKADSVFYNPKNDVLYAKGNVVFIDDKGNVMYSNEAVLDPKIQTGMMKDFKAIFIDKSTMFGKSTYKMNENNYNLSCIEYTACSIANNNTPTWELNASQGIYNKEAGSIQLNNIWVELEGIPLVWLPYFSFSNLDFKRKAGFLIPTFEQNSIYGASLTIPFYLPLGESQDMVLNTHTFFNHDFLYQLNYQGYIKNGSFDIDTSYVGASGDEERQGHFFMYLDKELSSVWRATVQIEETSDRYYLDRYDINPKDSADSFLTDRALIEGFFSHNTYFSASVAKYNSINDIFNSTNSYSNDINMQYVYYSDYSKFGRLNLSANASSFIEDTDSNVFRMIIDASYKYYSPTITGNYSVDLLLRSGLYSDTLANDDIVKDSSYAATGMAFTWEYPLMYDTGELIYTIAPIAQISYSKYLNDNDNAFLLDSFNTNITANNLFDINHFQGYDQFEESRDLKYALQFSLLNNSNQGSRVFVGQMLRKPFESTLIGGDYTSSTTASNYFISIYLYPIEGLYFNYDGIVDKDFKQTESSISTGYSNKLFSTSIIYDQYSNLDEDIYSTTSLSELTFFGSMKINKNNDMYIRALYDVGNQIMELKELDFTLKWYNECLEIEGYLNKEFYTSERANSIGIRVNIRSIDNYNFSI